ncbi:MAG: ABC transporter permease [Puia sp.]|nr:ABC transporter permease [Puia sp.]
MLKNYFKTAFRSLLQNRSHSIVNIAGLVVGVAACLLIFLVLQFEKSFDNFHPGGDRIYRLVREGRNAGVTEYRTGVPFPVPDALRAEYPQLEKVAAIFQDPNVQLILPAVAGAAPKKFKEDNGVFIAEPAFFELFNFKMLIGNPATAISEPNTVMLTRSAAEQYFTDWRGAIGKPIRLDGMDMKITGILDNPPSNTDFPLKFVISYATLLAQVNKNEWGSISDNNYCFVRLQPGYPAAKFNTQLRDFVTKHISPDHSGYEIYLQSLGEIHYDERFGNFNHRTFSKGLITALSLIGLFLLIIACINFINLSTARAVLRAKEVGIRKVLGSSRRQLVLQFLGETGLICLLALLLAMAVAALALPFLNNLLETQLHFRLFENPALLLFLLTMLAVIIVLSGFYPALVLSGFNPINALKSRFATQTRTGVSLRMGLVIVQFVIAQALIIGTLVVVSQMDFFKNADLGFNKTSVVNIPFPRDSVSRTKLDALRDRMLAQPGIGKVSFSLAPPTGGGRWFTSMQFITNHTEKPDLSVTMEPADSNYFGLYKLQMAAGHIYNESDTMRDFVVNETFLNRTGLGKPQEAVGKRVRIAGRPGTIVGVVRDYHINSLRDPVDAIAMMTLKDAYSTANVQLQPGRVHETLTAIEALWNQTFPDFVFEYHFLDQAVADYYKQENKLAQLYKIFSGIAILISCLGLYGLVSFMAVRRNKEIGIRKVVGASVADILWVLSREFTGLILLSFVIACPVAWYYMHQWLQQYSFRIEMGAGFFVGTLLASMGIAWLTVGHSAINAARANPVKSLRSE